MLVEAVHGGDVRVIQRGQELGLALEAREAVLVGGQRRRQRLDRDFAAELGIARAIDLAHAARADQAGDLIGAKTRAFTQ